MGQDDRGGREVTTGEIRDAIWKRQDGLCIRCGDIVTKKTAHLHEQKSRGRGGEISLENSIILCFNCHLGARGVHPEKQIKWTKEAM
jgi:5-methylcytosine-specific restriction endonuclease McrA